MANNCSGCNVDLTSEFSPSYTTELDGRSWCHNKCYYVEMERRVSLKLLNAIEIVSNSISTKPLIIDAWREILFDLTKRRDQCSISTSNK